MIGSSVGDPPTCSQPRPDLSTTMGLLSALTERVRADVHSGMDDADMFELSGRLRSLADKVDGRTLKLTGSIENLDPDDGLYMELYAAIEAAEKGLRGEALRIIKRTIEAFAIRVRAAERTRT